MTLLNAESTAPGTLSDAEDCVGDQYLQIWTVEVEEQSMESMRAAETIPEQECYLIMIVACY